jgi:hypothetical protein
VVMIVSTRTNVMPTAATSATAISAMRRQPTELS